MTPEAGPAKPYCTALKEEGVLCKDTVKNVMRLAPPLIIDQVDLDWALERVAAVLA